MLLQLLLPPVVFPASEGEFDIALLAVLGSPGKKDDDALAVLTEVNPVARSEINPALEDTRTNTLHVGEVPQPYSVKGSCHFSRGFRVQAIQPFAKRAMIVAILVLSDLNH